MVIAHIKVRRNQIIAQAYFPFRNKSSVWGPAKADAMRAGQWGGVMWYLFGGEFVRRWPASTHLVPETAEKEVRIHPSERYEE